MRSVSWRHSRAAITAAVLTTLPLLASGYSVALSAYDPSTCTGVLGGSSLKLLFDQSASISAPALLSVLVYNIADEERFVDPVSGRATLCPPGKYCAGQFIVQDSQPFKHPYLNLAVTFNDSHQASIWRNTFDFADTGLYCVATELNTPDEGHSLDFRINALFEAPYGKLPGADFPKLGLFLGLSVTYLVIGSVWFMRSWMFWRDILMLQHYISCVTFFLMVEMAFNYGYYEDYNLSGEPHTILLVLVIILNAGRNSISFFMLLIVSLGYGVVKPTLGTNMKKCVILSVIHFLAGVLYGAGALIINEISAPLALMFSLPLSFAMTVFYYSILNGLADTMANLTARRQPLKLLMYQRLWRILVFSAIILVLFFIANTVAFKYRTDPAWLPVYWQYRWLLLDGWLNILYLVVYLSIALLWRPTENNQRYGLEQLAGDDYDEEEAGMAAGAAGPGITQPAQRKIHLRTIHTDETLDEEADEEEDEDDVFRWAEENVGREVGSAGGAGVGPGTAGGSGMPRDSSQAGLLDPEEGTGSQKMA